MNIVKLYNQYAGKTVQFMNIKGTVVGYNSGNNNFYAPVLILGVEDGDYPCWPSEYLEEDDVITIKSKYFLYVLPEDVIN